MREPRKDEGPHVRLFQHGNVLTCLPATAYESLTHALMSGAMWWEGTTLHGAAFVVRCSSINDVHLMTAPVLASVKAEDDDAQWQAT